LSVCVTILPALLSNLQQRVCTHSSLRLQRFKKSTNQWLSNQNKIRNTINLSPAEISQDLMKMMKNELKFKDSETENKAVETIILMYFLCEVNKLN